jgi:hypothetical protein
MVLRGDGQLPSEDHVAAIPEKDASDREGNAERHGHLAVLKKISVNMRRIVDSGRGPS